jgi:hypothetical protein
VVVAVADIVLRRRVLAVRAVAVLVGLGLLERLAQQTQAAVAAAADIYLTAAQVAQAS